MRFVRRFTACVLIAVCLAAPALGVAAEPAQGDRPANRLAKETSPYLLLHAHNPVDWYPWGEEALAQAKRENKPIFLSVGYSSCYWCHVMERESFLDAEIAAFLNEHFVCIKVDREERPDIDEIYMTSVQVYHQLAGAPAGGGWPMSVFLTPDALPFFGGSYFPPRDQEGRTGFLTVLQRVDELWKASPDRIQDSAKQIAELVSATLSKRAAPGLMPTAQEASDALQAALAEQFDAQHGGFGFSEVEPNRPKFPEPANLEFLLARAAAGNEDAQNMLRVSLDHMARGGLRDHLGGGFHRYSTDRAWAIPHFEKMLYDNAQLISVYSAAFELNANANDRETVAEAIGFVLREMTSPEGGFYSALDAETAAEEGAYYAWTKDEINALLTQDEAKLLATTYGLNDPPNFEGRYVLLLPRGWDELAADAQLTAEQLRTELVPIRAKLLDARSKRPRPLCDTKIITAWNGLMIAGLADAGRVFQNDEYLNAARRAAEFALTRLRRDDGRLWHVYAGGEAKLNAYADDYAYLAAGLLALHRATGEERWLQAAEALASKQHELFWDAQGNGYFYTSHDHEQLFARSKDPMDGVLPSTNAVSAQNWIALAAARSNAEYRSRAEQSIQAFGGYLRQFPAGMPRMALALHALRKAQDAAK